MLISKSRKFFNLKFMWLLMKFHQHRLTVAVYYLLFSRIHNRKTTTDFVPVFHERYSKYLHHLLRRIAYTALVLFVSSSALFGCEEGRKCQNAMVNTSAGTIVAPAVKGGQGSNARIHLIHHFRSCVSSDYRRSKKFTCRWLFNKLFSFQKIFQLTTQKYFR